MTGRYFRFTSNGSNKNSSNHYVEIQIFDVAGTNLALNRTVEYSYKQGSSDPTYVTNGNYSSSSQYFDVGPGKAWVIVDLETPQEVSSIKIWRYYADSRIYYNCTVEVSEDKENWYLIYSSDITGTYEETSSGYTISEFLSYYTSGEVEFIIPDTNKVDAVARSLISWDEIVPQGTSCQVLLKIDNGKYQSCTNNSSLPGISANDDLSDKVLTLKIILSTTNTQLTPKISNLYLWIQTLNDNNVLILYFKEGNTTSVQNAVGDIEITYDHEVLSAANMGGKIGPFSQKFLPQGLNAKNNPHDMEHLEVSNISATAILKSIKYNNTQMNEHLEISNISATAALKQIQYINAGDFEHIDIPNISATALLTKVYYTNGQENEHITVAVTAQGVLTRLEDL